MPNSIVVATGYYSILQHKLDRFTLLKFMLGLTISGIISLSTFYALNPAWWGAPIQTATEVIRLRTELVRIQIGAFVAPQTTHLSIYDHTNSFFRFVFAAEVIDNIHSQYDVAEQYHQSNWDGIPIGGSPIGGYIVMGLFVFGFIHLWRNKAILPEYRWLITIWGIGICLFDFVSIPFQWARYYIPAIVVVGMILAYSVVILSGKLWAILLTFLTNRDDQ